MNLLKALKTRLCESVDIGDWTREWSIIQEATAYASVPEADAVYTWVVDHPECYVDTRHAAATIRLREHKAEIRAQGEQLILSENPDDREVGLRIIKASQHPNGGVLAVQLLNDRWPYVRLQACELAQAVDPSATRASLEELTQHDEIWVREAATDLLEHLAR